MFSMNKQLNKHLFTDGELRSLIFACIYKKCGPWALLPCIYFVRATSKLLLDAFVKGYSASPPSFVDTEEAPPSRKKKSAGAFHRTFNKLHPTFIAAAEYNFHISLLLLEVDITPEGSVVMNSRNLVQSGPMLAADDGKPKQSALMRPCKLSPELQELFGEPLMTRQQLSKSFYDYLKEHNLLVSRPLLLISAGKCIPVTYL